MIKNTKVGGTDWGDGDVLYAVDQNDTFDAVVDNLGNSPFSVALFDKTDITGTWNNSASDNDYYQIRVTGGINNGDKTSFLTYYFGIGTYKINVLYTKNDYKGILKVDVGGVNVLSQDGYAASVVYNQLSTDTFIITSQGFKTIELYADGKNGSSSDYTISVNHIGFRKTGA